MSNVVDSTVDKDAPNPSKNPALTIGLLGTIRDIISAAAGPAKPIVLPIAAGMVGAKWVSDVYQQSKEFHRTISQSLVGS